MISAETHHYPLGESRTRIGICYHGVDVHFDRHAILDEDLLQQHACNFTGLYVGVRHEMAIRPIETGPA